MARRSFRMPLVVLLASLSGAGLFAPARAQRSRETGPHDVILLGSSSVNGALGVAIESGVEESGLRVRRYGRSSTGFSRPDFFDWQAEIPRLGDLASMKGVLVYMGGNDGQAIRLREGEPRVTPQERDGWIIFRNEERWNDVYKSRVRTFVDSLCEAGVGKVIVILPTEGEDDARYASRMGRIQALQTEATRGSRCGVVADPRGVRLPAGATADGVHLTRTGAQVVWRHIATTVLGALGRAAH